MPVIFISYRRSDSQDVTGRIYDRLVAKYTPKNVFKDVDNIPLGVSFPMHIKQMLTKANVALVIIGPTWVNAIDKAGQRRLDDPNDYVRLEVEVALKSKMPVIPVLVGNATMPTMQDLPLSLRKLLERNGIAVRPDPDFNTDITRLFTGIEHLEKLLKVDPGKPTKEKKDAAVPPSPTIETGFTASAPKSSVKSPAAKPARNRRHLLLGLGIPAFALFTLVVALLGCFALRSFWPDAAVPVIGSNDSKAPKDPKNPKAGDEITNNLNMKFAWIPPGTFMMGSSPTEQNRGNDEPQHRVKLTKGFWMSIYPVTQAQWRSIMGNNPSNFKGDDLPVEKVSWNDCADFCAKLSKREGKSYRLPTEAEFEYACRAGSQTAYHFGDDPALLGVYAWFDWNAEQKTYPVGQKKPNDWGLYDMHGNVWQWCQDWYDADYYSISPPENPVNTKPAGYRVVRAGSWHYSAAHCRSAHRYGYGVDASLEYVGFRVVLSATEKSK